MADEQILGTTPAANCAGCDKLTVLGALVGGLCGACRDDSRLADALAEVKRLRDALCEAVELAGRTGNPTDARRWVNVLASSREERP